VLILVANAQKNQNVLNKMQPKFDQMDYFHAIFMNPGTPQMRPDKCRSSFILKPTTRHRKGDSKQKILLFMTLFVV